MSTPLQLYVHIPFCLHKCHYCDFNSHEHADPDWNNYQRALISELEHWAESPMFADRKLSSIFFGGGTPSLAPVQLIDTIMQKAESALGFEDHIEVTLEANPGTVDAERFSGYLQAGVNRLSMGVQSLDDQELLWLERIHDSKQALAAFDTARHAGFDNISLDLMYGLPNQSLSHWQHILSTAIKLNPEHLSCYQLTVEPHTKLAARHARKSYPLPDEDLALSFFHETRQQLHKAGYEAYEISNFAKPGYKCRHNDGYWLYHDYIGIGAGAAGKWDIHEPIAKPVSSDRLPHSGPFTIWNFDIWNHHIPHSIPKMDSKWDCRSSTQSCASGSHDGGITRYSNIRSPERYIQACLKNGTAIHSQETLNIKQAAAEACWLALRRSEGVNRSVFADRFGFDVWQQFTKQLQPWRTQNQLAIHDTSIRLTGTGLAMADAIAASVL